MNRQLLLDSLVRQTTVLMAALATSGGRRAPLAHVAQEVFLHLSQEIEAQGVSRKVTADMFGLALRSYQRKIQRAGESGTERGVSLWQGVLTLLERQGKMSRRDIFEHFKNDDIAAVRGVLFDLKESGLVTAEGAPGHEVFSYLARDDLSSADSDVEDLLCAILFRSGRVSLLDLVDRTKLSRSELEGILGRLAVQGRIECHPGEPPCFEARKLTIPFESAAGWEASVYDHYSALVRAICAKLHEGPKAAPDDWTGGSTVSMEVWDGHPLEEKVTGTLARMRKELIALRREVSQFNEENEVPDNLRTVVTYVGQSVILDDDEPDT